MHQAVLVQVWDGAIPALNGCGGIREHLKLHRPVVEARAGEDVHRSHKRSAARFVFVKQVAAQQHHVCILVLCKLEHLLKGAKRVLPADVILLPDTLMIAPVVMSSMFKIDGTHSVPHGYPWIQRCEKCHRSHCVVSLLNDGTCIS